MGDVKLALLLGFMLGRTVPVALMIGVVAALVPSAVLVARHGSAARKMKIPFGPFLALGGIVALFWGDCDSRRLPASDVMLTELAVPPDEQPRLRPVPPEGGDADPGGRPPAAPRAAAFAGSLDTARALAEQFHLPLVDLAVEGVDAAAAEADPAARARARVRDPVRVRRRAAADRDHRAAERPRARRAPAGDPALRPSSRSRPATTSSSSSAAWPAPPARSTPR